MIWPWKKERERPDLEQTRAELARIRARREEVHEVAEQIRIAVVKNNFAANTFQLIAPRGRR